MFTGVMIFVILLSAVVDVLLYLQSCIANKKAAQTSSDIAVANSVWARLNAFKRTITGNAFCYLTPGYSFAYPLKFCSNRNDNDPSGSLLGSSLKYYLKD